MFFKSILKNLFLEVVPFLLILKVDSDYAMEVVGQIFVRKSFRLSSPASQTGN